MKKLIFIVFFLGTAVHAETTEFLNACPAGFLTVDESDFMIVDDECPVGYISVGSVISCNGDGFYNDCTLHADAFTDYFDITGKYQFEEVCAWSPN